MSSSLYTSSGVHRPLASKLPDVRPLTLGSARFSKTGHQEGVGGQRDAWLNQYADEPDVALIRQMPDAAWDPTLPAVGAQHGVTWIRMSDLHHTLTKDTPVAAVVVRGDTLFVSLMLSATAAHIVRDDGSKANAGTWLILSLLKAYPSARRIKWAEDPTRAARTGVNWELVKETCHHGHTLMVFGGRTYDLSDKADRTSLNLLTAVSSGDDLERRAHLTGKRVEKMSRGGAAVPEEGMPRGWVHTRDQFGRRQRVPGKGLAPRADPNMVPVLKALYTRYAAGATYQDLAPLLTEFENQGLLTRRDPNNPGNTYQDLHTAVRAHDAVKPFFCVRGTQPTRVPDEQAIAAYEAGADPADVFDWETRVYISRIEVVRTSVAVRRLVNDIPGIRDRGVDGHRPVMKDETDQMGSFYIESEPWPWPVDEDGNEVVSFGVEDRVLRQCAARLLRQLSRAREQRGGRRRGDGQRRLLQNFPSWTAQPGGPGGVYDDVATAWGVRARVQNSGKATFSLMHRRSTETGAWGYLPNAASGSLAELVRSLASCLEEQAGTLLDAEGVPTVAVVRPTFDQSAVLNLRAQRLETETENLEKENRGLRRLAARAEENGQSTKVSDLEQDEADNRVRMREIERELETLRRQLETASDENDEADEGDLNLFAYLVAVLERSADNHGVGSERAGRLCDRTFTSWRFGADDQGLWWTCDAQLPLKTGDAATLPLSGRIRNLRNAVDCQRAQVSRYIFGEGRSVDEVAAHVGCGRRALYNRYLMPWLRDNRVIATGAKCALVDHPFGLVRKIVWTAVRDEDDSRFPVTPDYLQRVKDVYLNPRAEWGGTTVPDDTAWIQRAVDILASDEVDADAGMAVDELALILGRTEERVRDLACPRARKYGFVRPVYIEYTSPRKDRVRGLKCPHDGSRALHVALFPEVAASGLGLLCRLCRRAPKSDATWADCVFPAQYVAGSWTRRLGRGSIIDGARTVSVSERA